MWRSIISRELCASTRAILSLIRWKAGPPSPTEEIIADDLSPVFSPDQKFTKNSWISSQTPQPNTMVAVGSTVELTVSNLNPP